MKSFEIVTIAVFAVGGDSTIVDTEDVAVEANRLAPGLFTWRKYKDQISFDHIRRQLIDATRPENGAYLVGSVRSGWQLTEAGREFCNLRGSDISNQKLRTSRLNNKDAMRLRLEKERLRSTKAYEKFCTGRQNEITDQEARAFFRIDEYVPAGMRESKMLRILNNFTDDAEFGELVHYVASRVRGN